LSRGTWGTTCLTTSISFMPSLKASPLFLAYLFTVSVNPWQQQWQALQNTDSVGSSKLRLGVTQNQLFTSSEDTAEALVISISPTLYQQLGLVADLAFMGDQAVFVEYPEVL